ncbi:MAG: pyroglutamyl-peptidase I [Chloroflexi bacterium]|nr:pyroglutamyl-peptidase I [Chloroflexota bacterium]
MEQTLLITAFTPFNGRAHNASDAALSIIMDLAVEQLPQIQVIGQRLPVLTEVAARRLLESIERFNPDMIICLGEARREAITPERFAVNERSFRIPDTAGSQPQGDPVVKGAPPQYETRLPADDFAAALNEAGFAANVSEDAGRYVCNEVFFAGLHHLRRARSKVPLGFVHVPVLPKYGQDDAPGQPAEKTAEALLTGIRVWSMPSAESQQR